MSQPQIIGGDSSRNVVGDGIDIVAKNFHPGGVIELCQIAVLKPPATDQLHGKECFASCGELK